MNCYVCDQTGRTTPAVASCHHCAVALCREHLDEDLIGQHRPHGLTSRSCSHDLVSSAQARARWLASASQ
jgi:hypothetical protein